MRTHQTGRLIAVLLRSGPAQWPIFALYSLGWGGVC